MCVFYHSYRLISCEPKKKLFVTERRNFYFAYITTWKCVDCGKEIKKTIREGYEGWKTLQKFLQKQKGHTDVISLPELGKLSSVNLG